MRLLAIIILLAVSFVHGAQADSLGRLFFTPEQRAQLEHNQAHNATAEGSDTTSELIVNGIVQKRGGKRIAWINGKAQHAGNSDELSPESLAVTVPGKAQPVKLKVGQKLLLDNPPQSKPAPQKPSGSDG